ncbi:MAG: nuclear transport factor 2 family protein [Pseudomonadota bacterium]
MPQESSNKTLMLSVIAAFKESDLEPLFAALHPDVVWKASAPREFFRFGGTHRGHVGMREYTALLFSRYHFVRLDPRTITTKGDQVWGVFAAEALHRPSGRYVKTDIAMRWTVKDGKITEHQGFFDTAGVLIQQGELMVAA